MRERAFLCVAVLLIVPPGSSSPCVAGFAEQGVFADPDQVGVEAKLVELAKIWDEAPHNAFTDLIRWKDSFYCVFRQGKGHVSSDGAIRVLKSKDASSWEPMALVTLDGYDLRDPHVSVTPDNTLMLLGGAAPRKQDNQSTPTGTFVCFSKDGQHWTEPRIVIEPGRWLWRVTWHKAKAYGVSYAAPEGMPYLDLLTSSDGVSYEQHVARLFGQGYPTEVTLRFDTDGTCYALVRRDRLEDQPSSALLGVSRPNYTQWNWHDLGADFNGFGGPNFIRLPAGHWIGAGRMHDDGTHTALTYVDVKNGTMAKLLRLPSGGDTSYPGLLWHENLLYVSYYSSHEGNAGIYLAKVRIKPRAAPDAKRMGIGKSVHRTPYGGNQSAGLPRALSRGLP
jgi:hypothetical protein